MKATRTVAWTTKTGRTIEVKIERNIEVQDKIAYADGGNVNLGKETYDHLYIGVKADGKIITRSYNGPEIIEEKFYRNYKELRAKGAYARLGNTYINEEQYNMIMAVLAEIEAELTPSPEFKEIKAQEVAKETAERVADEKEAAEHAQMVKSGLCPKCHTWCYGDCEAH